MRILLCLVLLSTSSFASVDLNVFTKNLKLPQSSFLLVEDPNLMTINCKDTQHHLTFSYLKDGEFAANSFLEKAKSEK